MFGQPRPRQIGHDGLLGVLDGQAVVPPRVDEAAGRILVGDLQWGRGVLARCRDHPRDGKTVRFGEVEVPFVVSRDRHDGPGAVSHEDVVGDPDRYTLSGGRIDAVAAREDSGLVLLDLLARHQIHRLRPDPVGLHRLLATVAGNGVHQRVLGSEYHIGGPAHRVGACREDLDLEGVSRPSGVRRSSGNRKAKLCAHRTPDPVGLGLERRVGPVDVLKVAEQSFRVIGDPEEPLPNEPLFDCGAAALALSHYDLLVGKHRHARRAPVDRRLLLLREPPLEKLEEEPLGPLVVGGIGRIHRVVPVEHAADPTQLPTEIGDVAGDEPRGMDAGLERKVLGVDPEGVEADGLEDVVPLEALEAPVHIGAGERVDVAHMKSFGGRIREHHEVEERAFGAP